MFWYFCTFSFWYDFSIRRESLLCSSRRSPRLLYTLSNIAQLIRGAAAGSSVKPLKCECEIATEINALSGWLFCQAPGMDANKWDFHFIRWIFLSFLAVLPQKRISCTAASLTVADTVNYFFSLTLLRKVIWICRSFHDLFFHMWVKDSSGLSNFFFFCKFVNPYLTMKAFSEHWMHPTNYSASGHGSNLNCLPWSSVIVSLEQDTGVLDMKYTVFVFYSFLCSRFPSFHFNICHLAQPPCLALTL